MALLLQLKIFFLWLVFRHFEPLVTPIPSYCAGEAQALRARAKIGTTEGVKPDERVTGKGEKGKLMRREEVEDKRFSSEHPLLSWAQS